MLKAPGEDTTLTFHHEVRFANSEDKALDEIMAWARDNFGDGIKILET